MSTNTNLFSNINNNLPTKNAQVVVVYTQWNEAIMAEMLKGCTTELDKHTNIKYKLVQVPGCIEIPNYIYNYYKKYAYSAKHPDAFIALGCVIKGETPHFEYVCQSVTQGISNLNTSIISPTVFGIITVLTEQQAYDRLGGKDGHKGTEAAQTALQIIKLNQEL
jgi:6,7-dimethyl-8-ribityllumazine synthase